MRLEASGGRVRSRDYPDYFDRHLAALIPPRCRICPDALAELADISIGDAWLDRFEGSDGVSDLIVRTPAGERLLADLAGRFDLTEASPEDMVASQSETFRVKRDVCRGRLWLRSVAGRPVPVNPGLDLRASPRDRWLGIVDAAGEQLYRFLADRHYPSQLRDRPSQVPRL
jgi:coenzyme F420 hydrogenase subunit beta